jgi:hypothetical protein
VPDPVHVPAAWDQKVEGRSEMETVETQQGATGRAERPDRVADVDHQLSQRFELLWIGRFPLWIRLRSVSSLPIPVLNRRDDVSR